ncbi:Ankyrin repeat and SAM domain-containing protein 1A [Halotydeus destructor]|nr:Ankyrin repeat and SAM domain-containing protein 1A [Halotydeus destructor]
MMSWTKKQQNDKRRISSSYTEYDAGPPLPPRNQLANARALRLSDSADLLYEVPFEFSNTNTPNSQISDANVFSQQMNVQDTYCEHPVYATVQRKPHKTHHRHQASDQRPDLTTATSWSAYSGGGGYATMTWKRVPPPKPPRKSLAPLNRSLSQQQYHSKSQHQLHMQSNSICGYEYVPSIQNNVFPVADMKRSASNDGDAGYSELKCSNSANNSRPTLLTVCGQGNEEERDSLVTSDSAFGSLYDEIASANYFSLNHPNETLSATESGYDGHLQEDLTNVHPPGEGCLVDARSRAPQLQHRSKSEHHPLCPNFHTCRPPLPPKPCGVPTIPSKMRADSLFETYATLPRKRDSLVQRHCQTSKNEQPVEKENQRPPSPESTVDQIRSVIKPLSKEYKLWMNGFRKNVETLVEENLFSVFDSTGRMVQVRARKPNSLVKSENKFTITDIPWNDVLNIRLRETSSKNSSSSTLPRSLGTSKPKRTSVDESKKSLRRSRNAYDFSGSGTTERLKKKSFLSKSSRSTIDLTGGDTKGEGDILMIKSIDIDCASDPVASISSTTDVSQMADFEQPKSIDITCSLSDEIETASAISGDAVIAVARPKTSLIPFNSQWAEIEKILESFGSDLCSNELFTEEAKEPEAKQQATIETEPFEGMRRKPTPPPKPSLGRSQPTSSQTNLTVSEWLAQLNLAKLSELFIQNGFDDLSFMGPNGLDASDLEEMGISEKEVVNKILDASNILAPMAPLERCSSVSVYSWLESLKLLEYNDNFKEAGFADIDRVRRIWEVELNALLGVRKLGHRKRILGSLGKRSSVISSSQLSLLQ